jgi:hypothetical protein
LSSAATAIAVAVARADSLAKLQSRFSSRGASVARGFF